MVASGSMKKALLFALTFVIGGVHYGHTKDLGSEEVKKTVAEDQTLGNGCSGGVRVVLQSGAACGLRRRTAAGVDYASFLGLPYAKQPVGELRYKKLQEVENWNGTFDATIEGPMCLQPGHVYGPDRMREDCIYANVHVPMSVLPRNAYEIRHRRGKPQVLIFIHGGAFSYGSGDPYLYGPEYLIDQKIILITFNYRLGPLGFLDLNGSNIPVNLGLHDVVKLTQWVKKNVDNFGAHFRHISIAGYEAGATIAHLLTLSSITKRNFERAILLSGTATRSFFSPSREYSKLITKDFLEKLQIETSDPEKVELELRNKPYGDIIIAQNHIENKHEVFSFGPVVETSNNSDTIIPDFPENLIAMENGAKIPFLCGFTTTEMESFQISLNEKVIRETTENANPLSPRLYYSENKSAYQEAVQKYKLEHNSTNYADLLSDLYVKYPMFKLMGWRHKIKKGPTYLFKFTYENNTGYLKSQEETANFGDYLPYIFKVDEKYLNDPKKIYDQEMAQSMIKYIKTFLVYGKPQKDASCWFDVENYEAYQNFSEPHKCKITFYTQEELQMVKDLDKLYSVNPLDLAALDE